MRRFLLSPSVLLLAGCATTSFAPPIVNMDQELSFKRTQTFFNATCTPTPVGLPGAIKRNTEGALLLVNNFIMTYRCQAHRAAEVRQFFEVPGFLAAAGAATAAAFGAGPNVAIGAGAAGATLNQGKSYYAPKDKAAVFDNGLDAMICIKNEAVGIDPFTLKAISQVQETTGEPANAAAATAPSNGIAGDDGPEVYVTSERQYFDMIQAALFSVERVVAQRLSASGTPFDSDGVFAEIQALQDKAKEAEQDAGTPEEAAKPVTDAPAPDTMTAAGLTTAAGAERLLSFTQAKAKLSAVDDKQVGKTVIKLRSLQPKLQQCVVRAKV